MSPNERKLTAPSMNMESEAYWAAANDGKLLMKRCKGCGKTHLAVAIVNQRERMNAERKIF